MSPSEREKWLARFGECEVRSLPHASLMFVQSREDLVPDLEIVVNERDWISQLTIGGFATLDFGDRSDDQREAEAVLSMVSSSRSVLVEVRRQLWFITGDVDQAILGSGWRSHKVVAQWPGTRPTEPMSASPSYRRYRAQAPVSRAVRLHRDHRSCCGGAVR